MDELMVQLQFSFKSLFKHRVLLLVVFIFTSIIPLTLAQMSGESLFELRWLAMLQFQMIFAIPLIPVVVNTIWSGKLKDFELKTILLYLTNSSNYLLSKLIAAWAGLSMSLILLDTIYWLLASDQGFNILWAATVLQIILTISLVVSLTGIFSLIFKRTIYCVILVFLYLIISIQYLREPMFALWFNPDYIGKMLFFPHFTLQRCSLFLWAILILWFSSILFKKQVKRI